MFASSQGHFISLILVLAYKQILLPDIRARLRSVNTPSFMGGLPIFRQTSIFH